MDVVVPQLGESITEATVLSWLVKPGDPVAADQPLVKAKITGRSAHRLRHSYACALLARTGDLRLVQAAMNHASIVSTTVYRWTGRDRCLGGNAWALMSVGGSSAFSQE